MPMLTSAFSCDSVSFHSSPSLASPGCIVFVTRPAIRGAAGAAGDSFQVARSPVSPVNPVSYLADKATNLRCGRGCWRLAPRCPSTVVLSRPPQLFFCPLLVPFVRPRMHHSCFPKKDAVSDRFVPVIDGKT